MRLMAEGKGDWRLLLKSKGGVAEVKGQPGRTTKTSEELRDPIEGPV